MGLPALEAFKSITSIISSDFTSKMSGLKSFLLHMKLAIHFVDPSKRVPGILTRSMQSTHPFVAIADAIIDLHKIPWDSWEKSCSALTPTLREAIKEALNSCRRNCVTYQRRF